MSGKAVLHIARPHQKFCIQVQMASWTPNNQSNESHRDDQHGRDPDPGSFRQTGAPRLGRGNNSQAEKELELLPRLRGLRSAAQNQRQREEWFPNTWSCSQETANFWK